MTNKLDISKPYDKLEWSFLEAMIRKLGFNDIQISRIITCVTIVTYYVLVNGQPDSILKPSRGLH